MGPIDVLKTIIIIATACHLAVANWIKSNGVVSMTSDGQSMTLEGQRSHSRQTRAIRVQLTNEQIKELVNVHNYLRAREGASNMEFMTWNNQLAEMGQIWAERCEWKHGQPQYKNKPYDQIGQNLWAHEAGPNMTDALYAFWNEKEFYNYDTLTCRTGEVCGHYTQVVWASSKEVGCGLFTCPSVTYLKNAAYLVCNYGPPGNFRGQKPFLKGRPCTQCQSGNGWCHEGLCTDTCRGKSNCECAAICKNCATFKKDSCSCECDVGWTGPDCSEPCKDLAPQCGANPGWPFSWCEGNEHSQHVRENCPKFCNLCKSGKSTKINCSAKGEGPGLIYDNGSYTGNGAKTDSNKSILYHFPILVTVVFHVHMLSF